MGLFKRETPPPARPIEPQAFCTRCGRAMVDSYLVIDDRYSPTTGRPQEKRVDGRLCSSYAGRRYKSGGDHDGVYRTWTLGYWGYEGHGYWVDK